MTARPLLFHVVQKRLETRAEKETDWRVGLSTTTISMIDACVAAARDCTTMMASASKQNLWGKWIPLAMTFIVITNSSIPNDSWPKRNKVTIYRSQSPVMTKWLIVLLE